MTLIEQIKDLVTRVENGDMTAENARNFTGEEGKWVTIKGTHVFIPEGKEVDEVIKEKFGETEEKTEKKEEKKSYFKPAKSITQSLKDDYEAGKITAKEVAEELAQANLKPYVVEDKEALEYIGVKEEQSQPEGKKDKFRYDGKTKIKQITKKEWADTPKDYKTVIDGKKYIMYIDDETHATVLGRCEIIDDKAQNSLADAFCEALTEVILEQ